MNKNISTLAFLTLAVSTLLTIPGCGAIEGIFKAGMWIGILGVVAVVAIIFIIVKSFGGK